jgi:hypothetical protein
MYLERDTIMYIYIYWFLQIFWCAYDGPFGWITTNFLSGTRNRWKRSTHFHHHRSTLLSRWGCPHAQGYHLPWKICDILFEHTTCRYIGCYSIIVYILCSYIYFFLFGALSVPPGELAMCIFIYIYIHIYIYIYLCNQDFSLCAFHSVTCFFSTKNGRPWSGAGLGGFAADSERFATQHSSSTAPVAGPAEWIWRWGCWYFMEMLWG